MGGGGGRRGVVSRKVVCVLCGVMAGRGVVEAERRRLKISRSCRRWWLRVEVRRRATFGCWDVLKEGGERGGY